MILPGRFKLPADGCPAFIYTAADAATDIAQQGDTAGVDAFGSSHHQSKIVQLFGHLQWNSAGGLVFGFTPVKGSPVKGAAGAAAQAHIDNHFVHLFKFQQPRQAIHRGCLLEYNYFNNK